MVTNVLVPTGQLGAGCKAEEIRYGMSLNVHAIAADAGSTDSGAAYLAQGMSKNNREAVKADLLLMLAAQAEGKIPILIGTCGQAGGDAGVDWTLDIVLEVANELNVTPKIALLYSEQSKEVLKRKAAEGKIHALAPLGPITDQLIDSCDHVVAMMGPEPYIAALREGADIVLGGRTTDTAVLAAVPLMRGAPAGPAWHAGKVGECGAQCAEQRGGTGCMLKIDGEGFEVETLNPRMSCTPESVSAHMLYENSNPFVLTEPGGALNVTHSRYSQLDERAVRVTGSMWEEADRYTMKLEGAAAGDYQTLMLVGIEDPYVLADPELFHDKLLAALYDRVAKVMGNDAGEYHISLRLYGWNAVSGRPRDKSDGPAHELGVLFVATAKTQALATRIAKACNPYFFHYPMRVEAELPSYGFAFSPADVERGRIYEFKLNHFVEVDDPLELVRTRWVDMKVMTGTAEVSNA